jgi:hypothetical protein
MCGAVWAYLNQQGCLSEVQVRLPTVKRNGDRLQLLQVVLQLFGHINVPVLRDFAAQVQGTRTHARTPQRLQTSQARTRAPPIGAQPPAARRQGDFPFRAQCTRTALHNGGGDRGRWRHQWLQHSTGRQVRHEDPTTKPTPPPPRQRETAHGSSSCAASPKAGSAPASLVQHKRWSSAGPTAERPSGMRQLCVCGR